MPKLELSRDQLLFIREHLNHHPHVRAVDSTPIINRIDRALAEPEEKRSPGSKDHCKATVSNCNRRIGWPCSMCPWDGTKDVR